MARAFRWSYACARMGTCTAAATEPLSTFHRTVGPGRPLWRERSGLPYASPEHPLAQAMGSANDQTRSSSCARIRVAAAQQAQLSQFRSAKRVEHSGDACESAYVA